MTDKPDIASDIAAAIDGHLKALRLLKRAETTVLAVSEALGLPEPIVEKAFKQFRMTAARIDPRRQRATVSRTSALIVLGRPKRR